MHAFRPFSPLKITVFMRRRTKMLKRRRLSCGRVWMPAAGQRHIGVHVRTDTHDGATTRHARSDENQEEEFSYGKSLSRHASACSCMHATVDATKHQQCRYLQYS